MRPDGTYTPSLYKIYASMSTYIDKIKIDNEIYKYEKTYISSFINININNISFQKGDINQNSRFNNFIKEHYNERDIFYTDGSKDSEKDLVGCAFTCPKLNVHQNFKLNANNSIFSLETLAFLRCLE